MADINIQRKKNTPSPWLLLLLVLAVVGLGAWFMFKAEVNATRDMPPPPPPPPAETSLMPADSLAGAETGPRPDADAVNELANASVTPEVLAAFAASDAARPGYGREGLRLLTASLVGLADRDDLRTSDIQTRRDDLTSATARLDEPASSLRPGLVAAARLVQAMQQQGYPALESEAQRLAGQADELSGQTATPAQQQALRDYFGRATALVQALNAPPVR